MQSLNFLSQRNLTTTVVVSIGLRNSKIKEVLRDLEFKLAQMSSALKRCLPTDLPRLRFVNISRDTKPINDNQML